MLLKFIQRTLKKKKEVQHCSVEKPIMNNCPILLLDFANNYKLNVNEVRIPLHTSPQIPDSCENITNIFKVSWVILVEKYILS